MNSVLEKNLERAEQIERYIRILTLPVGIKMIKKDEKIPREGIVKLPDKYNICQFVTLARYDRCHQDVYLIEKENINCGHAKVTMGFENWSEYWSSGEAVYMEHHDNLPASKESVVTVPRIGLQEEIQALVMGPLEKFHLEPDLIAFTVIPGQLNRVSEGYQWFNSGGFNIRYSGICGICGWGIAKAYAEKTLAVGIPCQGARRFAIFQDIELFVAVSMNIFDKWLDGLEKTLATGHSYPIGVGFLKNPPHAPHYRIVQWPDKVERIC